MPEAQQRRSRPRGNIELLPSGARRVKVYAGIDPLTGRRHYLTETVPPPANPSGDRAALRRAEQVLTRLLNDVNERRNPRTRATVSQLLDEWWKVATLEPATRQGYGAMIRKHIRPLLGKLPLGQLDGRVFDSFYAELRRCRDHCSGKPGRAGASGNQHSCRPLGDSGIRQIHWILSAALSHAVRWKWLSVNPIAMARPPAPPSPDPRPPSSTDAARLVVAACEDPDWGVLIWLAMTTGARRGELCALRWEHVDLDAGVVDVRRAISQDQDGAWYEKDTKTHQQRRIALDEATVEILHAHQERASERASRSGK